MVGAFVPLLPSTRPTGPSLSAKVAEEAFASVGLAVGRGVGAAVLGAPVGTAVGAGAGATVGLDEGAAVGGSEGDASVSLLLESRAAVGAAVGFDGICCTC